MSISTENPVINDATDYDIIVMLVSDDRARDNLVLQSINKRYNISAIKSKLAKNVIDHILVTHAISACDGTSAIYKKQRKPLSMRLIMIVT